MKAVICTKYGPPEVLQIREVEKPVPKENEVLIRIKTTSLTTADIRIRGANFPWLVWLPMRIIMGFGGPRKKILGVDFAGVVESIGEKVSLFKNGDPVFGSTYPVMGGHAEFICMPENEVITLKPDSISYETAAAIFFGAHTALHFLRKGKIQKGQSVLIYGASGSIGTYAVQLAKYFGAEVTAVCSGANEELVKSLGADKVIDYTKEDFSKSGDLYDIIFDTVGESSFSATLRSLRKKGYYLRAVHLELFKILRGLWTNLTSSKKVIGGEAAETLEALNFLKELVVTGDIKPVIDRVYKFEEIPDAHRYVDSGRKKGNVVITIEHK